MLTGTVAAQAIPFLVAPLLTRLVTPDDMGLYSAWLGLVTIAAVIATFRLEVVMVVCRTAEERRLCVELAVVLGILVAGVCVFIGMVAEPLLERWIRGWSITASAALGAAIWGLAMSQVWRSYAVAEGRFVLLGWLRIWMAAATAVAQVVGAGFSDGGVGMMWGYAIGALCAIGYAELRMGRPLRRDVAPADQPALQSFVARHRRLAMVGMPSEIINNIANQLPVLLISWRFGLELAGLYALTARTLDAPASVISASALDAYKQRAADEFRRLGNCRAAYLDTLKMLAAISLVPTVVVLAAGPTLFAWVYGEAWRQSGVLALILMPMYFIRFFASPLGYTLYITGAVGWQLAWQVALLGMTLCVFLLPTQGTYAIAGFSAGYAGLYVVYLWMTYRAASGAAGTRPAVPPAVDDRTV